MATLTTSLVLFRSFDTAATSCCASEAAPWQASSSVRADLSMSSFGCCQQPSSSESSSSRPWVLQRKKRSSRMVAWSSAEGSVSSNAADLALQQPTSGGNDGSDDSGSNGYGGGRGEGGGGAAGDGAGAGGESSGDDFGPVLGLIQVQQILQKKGVQLPADILASVETRGIPQLLLERYLQLQSSPLAPLMGWSVAIRNRLLADPSFLFKIVAEVCIDFCCATFAEVQKRGDDFWKEFELYASDMLVGIVMDIALVGMLAPVAKFGSPVKGTAQKGLQSKLSAALAALPNSMFQAALPGQAFSPAQRAATWFVKAGEYGAVGFVCGLVGQSLANGIITLKRNLRERSGEVVNEEEEVKVPPLLQTAALWGVFMAVSSNTRYQVVNGLERVVESSVIARKVPFVAQAFTVGVRFGNNIYGGMQFVDWARWSGVQ